MNDRYAPSFDVRVAGAALSADVADLVTSLSYDNNADMADMFQVTLLDPEHRLSDSPLFALGKQVEIHMGYGHELRPMMLGEITALSPSYPSGGAPTLTISGYDRSHRLRHNQPDRPAWRHINDSAIAAQIAREAGLVPVVDPSAYFHDKDLPQTSSDFAFLKERARANYFELFVHWDRLYFRLPRPQLEAIRLEWGHNLASFSPRLSDAAMAGVQVIRGYNEQLAQEIVAFATTLDVGADHIVDKLGTAALEGLGRLGRRAVTTKNVESPFDAAALAKALVQEMLDGMYEGSGSCIGLPELRANQTILIGNVGKRFSGRYRLKKVTHTIDEGGFRTSFEVSQSSATSFLQTIRKEVAERPSPNEPERFYGVVVGEVTANDDPEGRGRVRVKYPWLSSTVESPWARVATPSAGEGGVGIHFLPDVGDEVLVGFQHGDFASPIVVGSLRNGRRLPPVGNQDGRNTVRTIRTRAGHEVTLDDSEGGERVLLKAKGGSSIEMKANGDIVIKAAGELVLDAQNVKVKLPASGTMDVS